MQKFVIEGGERLRGTVKVGGAKNAVLPLLAATILSRGVYNIRNVPRLRDVTTMIRLMSMLGAQVDWPEQNALSVDTTNR